LSAKVVQSITSAWQTGDAVGALVVGNDVAGAIVGAKVGMDTVGNNVGDFDG